MQYDPTRDICVNDISISCNDRSMCLKLCHGNATITKYRIDNITATATSVAMPPSRASTKKFLVLANGSIFILTTAGVLCTDIDARFAMNGINNIWIDNSGTTLIAQRGNLLYESSHDPIKRYLPKWSPYNSGAQLDDNGKQITIQEFAVNSFGRALILTPDNQVYE